MATTYFSDLGKKADDLFKKGYPTKNTAELEVVSKAPNGVKFQGVAVRDRKDKVSGSVEQSYKFKDYGVEVVGNASSDLDKGLTGKVVYEPTQVRGLKTTVAFNAAKHKDGSGTITDSDEQSVTISADYKHTEYFALNTFFKLFVSSPEVKQSVVGAKGTFSYEGITVGGFAEAKLPGGDEQREVSKYGVTVDYSTSEFSVTGYSNNEKEKDTEKAILGLSYFHKITKNLDIGSHVFADTNKREEHPVKINFGAIWRPDAYSTLRGKVDAEGRVGLSFQQKINDWTQLTLAADVDATNLSNGASHKFGLGLRLGDE